MVHINTSFVGGLFNILIFFLQNEGQLLSDLLSCTCLHPFLKISTFSHSMTIAVTLLCMCEGFNISLMYQIKILAFQERLIYFPFGLFKIGDQYLKKRAGDCGSNIVLTAVWISFPKFRGLLCSFLVLNFALRQNVRTYLQDPSRISDSRLLLYALHRLFQTLPDL